MKKYNTNVKWCVKTLYVNFRKCEIGSIHTYKHIHTYETPCN